MASPLIDFSITLACARLKPADLKLFAHDFAIFSRPISCAPSEPHGWNLSARFGTRPSEGSFAGLGVRGSKETHETEGPSKGQKAARSGTFPIAEIEKLTTQLSKELKPARAEGLQKRIIGGYYGKTIEDVGARILVVGDLHHARNLADLEMAIEREAPDRVVFLGDYFDSWADGEGASAIDAAERAATWLRESLEKPNRICLWGNHDLAYAFSEPGYLSCSGATEEKRLAIESFLGAEDWAKLQLAHWEGDLLFTHAGLSRFHLPAGISGAEAVRTWLDGEIEEARAALRANRRHWILQAGFYRGSPIASAGGLTWCDYDHEFEPVPGVWQICGHTPQRGLRSDVTAEGSWNFCFDTNRENQVRHYGIWESKGFDVRTLDGRRDPGWKWPRKSLLPDRKWPVRLPGWLQVQP